MLCLSLSATGMDSEVDKYYKFYALQASGGGSYAHFEPLRRQRGRGLGDLLAGLFRRVLPYISGGLKSIGGEVLETTAGLIKDHLKGRDMAASLEERVGSAGSRLGEQAATALKGMVGLGIKRQRKSGRAQKPAGSTRRKTAAKQTRKTIKKAARQKKKKPKTQTASRKRDIFGSY